MSTHSRTTSKYETLRARNAEKEKRRYALEIKQKEREHNELKAKEVLAKKEEVPAELSLAIPGTIRKRCPKIEDHWRYTAGFSRAVIVLTSRGGRHRDIATWEPRGKSANALFQSLAEHLFAKYRTPPFLWSSFWAPDSSTRDPFVNLTVAVAAGHSMFKWLKGRTDFPVKMTQRGCHEYLQHPASFTALTALRHTQVMQAGGDNRQFEALRSTPWGQHVSLHEEFIGSYVTWLGAQGMFDPRRIPEVYDYILYQKGLNTAFSMKGRTGAAILRDTTAWHAELNNLRVEKADGREYSRCGIEEVTYDFSREGHKDVWSLLEILNYKDLIAEGKRQSHCVASYDRRVAKGETSIWRLIKEDNAGDWSMLTVEVDNGPRVIRQARGRYNRPRTPQETEVLLRWCTDSGLTLSSYA